MMTTHTGRRTEGRAWRSTATGILLVLVLFFMLCVDERPSSAGDTSLGLPASLVGEPQRQRLVNTQPAGDEDSEGEADGDDRGTDDTPLADKAAVPPADVQKEKKALVAELYRTEYERAQRREQRRELAEKMLQHARATNNDSAGKYVLMQVALSIAAGAGDADLAMEILDRLAHDFAIGADQGNHRQTVLEVRRDTLRAAAKSARERTLHEQVVRHSLAAVDEASLLLSFELAGEFSRIAIDSARKARDRSLNYEATRALKYLEAASEAFEEYEDDLRTLEDSPSDPTANGNLGRFFCFHLGGWEEGLSLLASGDDTELRRLASLELEPPEKVDLQLELADGWWSLAREEDGMPREHLLERAAYWYAKAAPQLEGLPKRKALARAGIDEEPPKPAPEPPPPEREYLTDLEPSEVRVLPIGGKERLTPEEARRKLFIPMPVGGEESLHGMWLHPPASKPSSAHIAFRLGGEFTKLSGKVGIRDDTKAPASQSPLTFRVVGDGKLLWSSRPVWRRGDTQPFSADVTGVDKLELFVDCPGNTSFAWAAWVDPVLEK